MFYFIKRDNHGNRSSGFTLLETMLVLILLSSLLGMLWSIVRLYSRSYLTTENRVGRSQLVRSLAQMMNDDLGSAIQDPIHPQLETTTGGTAIRRFGIRGNTQGLQIDVVQPNLFAPTATPEENRQVALGLGKSKAPQVPELKTIFYEFISPATMKKPEPPSDTSISSNITEDGMEERAPSGSQLVGSLQVLDNSRDSAVSLSQQLVEKFGLSRRELDFETPFENSGSGSSSGDSRETVAGSAFVGSLQTPTMEDLEDPLGKAQEEIGQKILTPTQLTMSTEEATLWAPEVVDCHFDYFDGKSWLTDWDSIKKEGLPVAIRVTLKLMSIDEVEILRSSPQFLLWSEENAPAQSTQKAGTDLGSRIVGSLLTEDRAEESVMADGTSGPDYTKMTFDELVESLGLPIPMTRQVVSWLPTTPLAGHKIMERRKPYTTTSNSSGGSGANSNRSSVAGSVNRTARNRQVRDRTVRDRQTRNREVTERTNTERTFQDRTATERTGQDRQTQDRTASGERNVRTRSNRERSVQERVPVESTPEVAQDVNQSAPSPPPSADPFAKSSVESDIFAPITEAIKPDQQGELSVGTNRSAAKSQQNSTPSQSWIRSGRK